MFRFDENNPFSHSGQLLYDGVPLLCFSFRLPSRSEFLEENGFYRLAAEREEEAMRKTLFPVLAARYDRDPDRRKRFRFVPFRLLSEAAVTFEDSELLSVRSTLCLSKGSDILACTVRSAVWRKKDGMLLSPRHCLALTRKVRQAAKGAVFYLENGRAVFEKDGVKTDFPLRKTKKEAASSEEDTAG